MRGLILLRENILNKQTLMKAKIFGSVFTFLFLFLTPTYPQNIALEKEYARYLSAYRLYQDSISNNLPEEIRLKSLQDYHAAKAAYEKRISSGLESGKTLIKDTIAPSPASNASSDDSFPSEREIEFIASEEANATFPAEIKSILERVWNSRKDGSPGSPIKELEECISRNSNSPFLFRAKYELAKAYELLKGDFPKALNVLSELSLNKKAGNLGILANLRASFLSAKKNQEKWKQALFSKNEALNSVYQKYSKTSWLAFPVKISRYFQYFRKTYEFMKLQEDRQKFQLWFEKFAAPFTPPVEFVFDQFKVPVESLDADAKVRLLYSNSESWFSRWNLLSNAKKSIFIQYFIVDNDVFGMSFLGLLLKKAREGVDIKLMVDARGTNKFNFKIFQKGFLQEMARFPNVEVKVFNTFSPNFIFVFQDIRKIISSNHDKILVIDEEYSLVGGRNIANEYLVDREDDSTAWLDCDVVIESKEIAQQMVLAFNEEFKNLKSSPVKRDFWGIQRERLGKLEAAQKTMDLFQISGALYQPQKIDPWVKDDLKKYNKEISKYKHLLNYPSFSLMEGAYLCPVKILDKNSLVGPRNDITDQLIRFIDGTKNELIIQNPYIVLTPRARASG
ncbi:hypothetical protein HYY75_02095 [bacterium]|nr:hypothetical protein [bacterium]